MRWSAPLKISMLIGAAFVALACVSAPAAAQNDPIGGFFRMLFGGQPQQRIEPAPVPEKPKPARPRPQEPKIVEVPKDANAEVVLVIGDSLATGMAQGLEVAFADTPGIVISNKTKPNSSLIREDDFDWAAQLPGVLADGRVDFVVFMLGVNDRQPIIDRKTGAKLDDVRSERWEVLYKDRLQKIGKILKDSGHPVYWVGMPPTERPSFSAFMGYLNELVKPIAEASGVEFVDIWPGFTDDEGNFSYSGPDVDGQEKRLRGSDGVTFTKPGQRKLAYFVEQSIRDRMRGVSSAFMEPSTPEAPAAQPVPQEAMLAAPPPLPPAPWKKVGPVMTLGDPGEGSDLDLAGATAGLSDAARSGSGMRQAASPTASQPSAQARFSDTLPGGYPMTETPLYRRLVRGEAIEVPPGRVDNFSWQRAR